METGQGSKRMELTFSITREDFWQFHKFYFERRGSFKRAALIFSISASLTGLALGVNGKLPWWGLLGIVVVAAPLGPLYARFCRWRCKRSIMRLLAKGDPHSGEQSLRINAEGVFIKSHNFEGTTRWGAVREIVETEEYIFILVDALSGLIIPRRVFPDPSSADAFVSLANSFRKNAAASVSH
jgi:hypothetical protein